MIKTFKFINLFRVCAPAYTHMNLLVPLYNVWQAEEKLGKSFLSFYHVSPGSELPAELCCQLGLIFFFKYRGHTAHNSL